MSDVWNRVGMEPEDRLRWLVGFGNLVPASLTDNQRITAKQEARAFAFLQEIDPTSRKRMRSWPAPSDDTPGVLTDAEVWRVQRWLKQGLGLLAHAEKWSFAQRVQYQLEAKKGLLFSRLKASSNLNQFKAMAYETFRDARLKFRLCLNCRNAFVPIRRQAYCSRRCSQAARTRRWRNAHPDRNRAIRRAQYQKSRAAKLKLSSTSAVKIRKSRSSKPISRTNSSLEAD